MKIAYTIAPGRGDTDLLLVELAERLDAVGVRTCGTVQVNSERDDGPCDMDVRVLPSGPTLRISQDLGPGARGCRLDPAALEAAVGLTRARLEDGADFLIVNKFGKHEAEGRGFRDLIAEALLQDVPVLVGLNKLNQSAFLEFTEGTAVEISPALSALLEWAKHARHASASTTSTHQQQPASTISS